jgi:hypothetical protein
LKPPKPNERLKTKGSDLMSIVDTSSKSNINSSSDTDKKPKNPKAAAWEAKKENWVRDILKDPNLTLAAKTVAIFINLHFNRKSHEAWPDRSIIMAGTALSEGAVKRAIKQLETYGYFTIKRGGCWDGKNVANQYHMIIREPLRDCTSNAHAETDGGRQRTSNL